MGLEDVRNSVLHGVVVHGHSGDAPKIMKMDYVEVWEPFT